RFEVCGLGVDARPRKRFPRAWQIDRWLPAGRLDFPLLQLLRISESAQSTDHQAHEKLTAKLIHLLSPFAWTSPSATWAEMNTSICWPTKKGTGDSLNWYMTCRTRVSTRSVLSPVSDFLGTTYGSNRTNSSFARRVLLPRSEASAGAPD